jgi:hypothetical protein
VLFEALATSRLDQPIHLLSLVFAGYASRELSDHFTARKYLQAALDECATLDRCRYAQAAHKMGESLSAWESVRFWHFWPTLKWTHAGAAWLIRAIEEYDKLPPDDLAVRQLGRAGRGTAIMNLAQLYRRAGAYVPGVRAGLSDRARRLMKESIKILEEKEKNLTSLPMAVAADAADNPTLTLQQKREAIDKAIEYSVRWNQEDIQIGSAYFAKGRLLATISPLESEACYLRALSAFRSAGMNAEIARTALELAFVLAIEARQKVAETQGSWEWKFGQRVVGAWKVVRALIFTEVIIAALVAPGLNLIFGVLLLR